MSAREDHTRTGEPEGGRREQTASLPGGRRHRLENWHWPFVAVVSSEEMIINITVFKMFLFTSLT